MAYLEVTARGDGAYRFIDAYRYAERDPVDRMSDLDLVVLAEWKSWRT